MIEQSAWSGGALGNWQEDAVTENLDEDRGWRVVLNDEEQYSVWWTDREPPAGWRSEGTEGTKEECLARIEELWIDMRPLSLRQRMRAQGS